MISFKTLRSLCIDFTVFFIPVYLLWQFFPYVLSVSAPFIAGFFLYLTANPLNRRLRKFLPPSFCAALSLLLISFPVFIFLRGLFLHLFREISSFTQNSDSLSRALPFISEKMSITGTSELFSSFLDAVADDFSTLLLKISSSVLGLAKNIPALLISVFATIFTSFFLLKDISLFKEFFRDFLGEKMLSRFTDVKKSILDAVFSYIKAQFIIGSIIFIILFGGFFFLGVKYALLPAFFTAIVDTVPILGTGAVLIPLSVFNFLTGEKILGWGILALYGVATITRQLCEPKIVGQKLGIHPLLTLFSLFAGLKLFGVFGLLFGPIAALLIKKIISARKDTVYL